MYLHGRTSLPRVSRADARGRARQWLSTAQAAVVTDRTSSPPLRRGKTTLNCRRLQRLSREGHQRLARAHSSHWDRQRFLETQREPASTFDPRAAPRAEDLISVMRPMCREQAPPARHWRRPSWRRAGAVYAPPRTIRGADDGGMVKRSPRQRLRPGDVAEARDGLRRILEAIGRGELTASPGYVARLEGAIAALSAMLGEPLSPSS